MRADEEHQHKFGQTAQTKMNKRNAAKKNSFAGPLAVEMTG